MTNTAVRTEVHQAFYVHRDFAAKITFDLEIRNSGPEICHLWLREILYLGFRRDTGSCADLLCARTPDTKNRRQRNNDVFVQRNVYACYTCHLFFLDSNLALLQRTR